MNPGNFMRCSCLMLPILWTILSFIFAIFVLVGNTTETPFPSDTYFIRVNVSGIGFAIAAPGETSAETIGLHDFCLWNYCEGYYRPDLDYAGFVTNCGPKDSNYYFNPISIVSTEVLPPYTIIFLQQEADAISRIQNNSNWLKAAFIIASICTGTTLLIGPLTGIWHERKLFNCIPVGCMCIAGIFWFSGAITATVIYTALRDSFNNDVELNIQAQTGRQMFVWVWLGAGTSCMSLSQWCCAAICCPGGHRKNRIEWRRRISRCVSD